MISIIMSTYKENEIVLRQAIESILNQTYTNLEFIIVLDNPENFMHRKIIQEYADADSRICFYANDANKGLAESLNRGLSLASGEYIARMDADDIAYPDRLEKQLQYIQVHNYDLIGGITQVIDENGTVLYRIKKVPSDPKKIKKCLKYGQVIAHPTWLGKREVFTTLKGYRTIPLCEDTDFTLRAVLNGYRISNLNEPILQYRMSTNSLSRSNLYEQYLYLKFITNEYKQGKIADINKANEYVLNHNDEKRARSYVTSNALFNKMLNELQNRQWLQFIPDGFRLLFSSYDYLNRIWRFFMITLNS